MATIMAILALSTATLKTIQNALYLYESAARNEEMVRELKEFMDELKRNKNQLENICRMGNGSGDNNQSGCVLDELHKDLEKARCELERILPKDQNTHLRHRIKNKIMRMGNCGEQIKSIREQIHRSFETKMLFLVLNVNYANMKSIEELKQNISTLAENWTISANPDDVRKENTCGLQCILEGLRSHEDHLAKIFDQFLRMKQSNSDAAFDSHKFYEYVVASLKDYQQTSPNTRPSSSNPVDVHGQKIISQDSCHAEGEGSFHFSAWHETIDEDLERLTSGTTTTTRLAMEQSPNSSSFHENAKEEESPCMGVLEYWESYKMRVEGGGSFHETIYENSGQANGFCPTPPALKMEQCPYLSSSSSFHNSAKTPCVSLSNDGLQIKFKETPTWWSNGVVAFKANQFVDSSKGGVFYFELNVKNHGRPHEGCVAIGFSDVNFMPNQLPGTYRNSCAYHSNTGRVLCTTNLQLQEDDAKGCDEDGQKQNTTFSYGDVVGAGIDHKSKTIFFVKNGQRVMQTSRLLKMFPLEELFPVVGLWTPMKEVHVNFGQQPFCYRMHPL